LKTALVFGVEEMLMGFGVGRKLRRVEVVEDSGI
jgi:hypothetical protein